MKRFWNTVKLGYQESKKDVQKVAAMAAAVAVAGIGATKASATVPSTGNADIDAILTPMGGVFDTVKTAFVWLAIGSIAVTLVVIAFFWLRGKLKQAVQGS